MELIIDQTVNTIEAILMIIGLASAVIKALPELPENHWAKPIIKFIGKNVALNRKSPTEIGIKLVR